MWETLSIWISIIIICSFFKQRKFCKTAYLDPRVGYSIIKPHRKACFPQANIFARSDVFPLSLSFRLKPSGTNRAQTKEKSRFARKYSLVENRLKNWLRSESQESQQQTNTEWSFCMNKESHKPAFSC